MMRIVKFQPVQEDQEDVRLIEHRPIDDPQLVPFETDIIFANIVISGTRKAYYDGFGRIGCHERMNETGQVITQFLMPGKKDDARQAKRWDDNGNLLSELISYDSENYRPLTFVLKNYDEDGTYSKEYGLEGKKVAQNIWWRKERGPEFLDNLAHLRLGKAMKTLFGENKIELKPFSMPRADEIIAVLEKMVLERK